MKYSVYLYQSYKKLLAEYLVHRGRGSQSELSKSLRCTKSYLSQVMNHHQHLTMEQAYQFSRFARLGDQEVHYFLTLVQYERSDNHELKKFLARDLERMRKSKSRTVSFAEEQEFRIKKNYQKEFYSAWRYMAIHTALFIPRLRTPKTIALYLGIPEREVLRILERLVVMGLASFMQGEYKRTHQKQATLDEDHLLIETIHRSCLSYMGDAIGRGQKTGNHYSSFIPLCHADMKRISAILSEATSKIHEISLASQNPDHVYFLSMGFGRANVDE